jgi:hypothetical protein
MQNPSTIQFLYRKAAFSEGFTSTSILMMNFHNLVACVNFFHNNIFYSSSYMLLGSTLQTVSHNAYHQDPYAQEFGIRISDQLAQVEARILPAPRVS